MEKLTMSTRDRIMYNIAVELTEAGYEKRDTNVNNVIHNTIMEKIYTDYVNEYDNLDRDFVRNKGFKLDNLLRELDLHNQINCNVCMFNIVPVLENYIARMEADLYIENNFGGK